MAAINTRVIDPESIIHSDGWHGYDDLVDVGYDKHDRGNHSHDEFARGNRHINGIESFWSFAKRRPVQFNGVPENHFIFTRKRLNLYSNFVPIPNSIGN